MHTTPIQIRFNGGEIYAKNRAEGGLEYFFSLKKQ